MTRYTDAIAERDSYPPRTRSWRYWNSVANMSKTLAGRPRQLGLFEEKKHVQD